VNFNVSAWHAPPLSPDPGSACVYSEIPRHFLFLSIFLVYFLAKTQQKSGNQKPVDGILMGESNKAVVGMSFCWENRDAYYVAFTEMAQKCRYLSVKRNYLTL
jgi:hypothetical protein